MKNRIRRSSTHVTLVLIGAAALSGCGRDATDLSHSRRDQYATREDCIADWGNPADCEVSPAHTSDGGRAFWWGPVYRGGWGSGTGIAAPRSGSRALGSHSVTRGGFGASGHAHGSGSS